MPTYRIFGTDGKEYGPVNAEVLREWIATKRASASTSIQAEGSSDWKPLSSFPEFADALLGGPPPSPGPPSSGPVRTSRLAIAALVCGVLGFGCLPAVAGVVLGILALLKISQSRGQLRGRGLAIAGICLSAVMMIAIVPAAMLLPALSKSKQNAMRTSCLMNLRQIGLGACMYADDRQVFPPDFLSLSKYLESPKVLVCPADKNHTLVSTWAEFDPRKNVTYECLKPGMAQSNLFNAMDQVLFRCPIHNSVGLGDGSAHVRGKTSTSGQPKTPR